MNVIDNDKLSATIATALADAQNRGVVLEDHASAAIHDILHGALLEAFTDVSGALAPVLGRLDALNSTITAAIGESAAWRAEIGALIVLLQRLDGATAKLHLGLAIPPAARPAETGQGETK